MDASAAPPADSSDFGTGNTGLFKAAIVPGASIIAFFEDEVVGRCVVEAKRHAARGGIEVGDCDGAARRGVGDGEIACVPTAIPGFLKDAKVGALVVGSWGAISWYLWEE